MRPQEDQAPKRWEHKHVRVDASDSNTTDEINGMLTKYGDWRLVSVVRVGDSDYRFFFTRELS